MIQLPFEYQHPGALESKTQNHGFFDVHPGDSSKTDSKGSSIGFLFESFPTVIGNEDISPGKKSY